ncbi:glycerol dehydrogenase [Stenotrophomonas sp. MMGLT7]|uniref:glycerol dehydrogenase n=1 Tax=Stenotrophomonas sp. MMGLT7 TaxID=2901227 RepID=UPI001E40E469|nr:glycerol dehydrogenase [Stenotrophomonas sp. MMGLT7]MCD7098071.1 glycerol dehydrogenase [Stenotrophomonas sp. MMGLT7]
MRNFIFSSPAKYVQGNGVLDQLGEYAAGFGPRALLVADDIVWDIVGERVESALAGKVDYQREPFAGESSNSEILRLAELARKFGSALVVGLGGGKTLDTVKAVADELKQPVLIVPTVASTDAPCSALSVIYSDDGVFEKYRFYDKNPDLVLVDTGVCAQAPVRLFASGIADGLATYVEALAVKRSNSASMVGGAPTVAAMAIAEACEKTLLTYGFSAYTAVAQQLVTPAVEAVVEANTLLSGLGFENAGLAGAHAIHNGFTAIQGDIHHLTHGEKVAYGTLAHMVLEQRSDEEIASYIRFYRSIAMPTTLEELHLEDASWEDLVRIGALANNEGDTLRNLSANFSAEDVAHAIRAVDAFSQAVD